MLLEQPELANTQLLIHSHLLIFECLRVCVFVCVCVRACVRVCVCVCMCALQIYFRDPDTFELTRTLTIKDPTTGVRVQGWTLARGSRS